MTSKQRFTKAMDHVYLACIALSGGALVIITLIIPFGVFMRYVMDAPLSWPEPAAVSLIVMFSFIGGAAVYRANVHIAVEALLNAVSPQVRRIMLWGVNVSMGLTAAFMLVYGVHLCQITWFQSVAEFPSVRQSFIYLPIPVAGMLTLLFLFERMWIGEPPANSLMFSDQPAELE
jgi:TRAP-type C4-dicarboxylate transport system permease small subunit